MAGGGFHGLTARAQGILLMGLAMLIVPGVDGLAKHLSATYSPLMIGGVSYVAAALMVTPFAIRRHGWAVFPQTQKRLHLLRVALLMGAGTLYFVAIARIPMATAVTAYFICPVAAALLAVLVLRERMTPIKLASLALGVAGAVVILQPGAGAIEPGVLFAFASGLAFAAFQVTTRKVAGGAGPLQTLAFQYVGGLAILGPQTLLNWTTPRVGDLWLFGAMAAISLATHGMVVLAYRRADASTLAPLTYLELVGATAIGWLAFGDLPGGPVLLGAALIVGAGALLLPRRAAAAPHP